MKLTTDWDLSQIYKTEDEALKDFEIIKEKILEKLNFKGKLNSKTKILDFYKLCEDVDILETKLFCYLSLRKALNGKDAFSRELESKFEYFSLEVEPKLAFVAPELIKNKSSFLKEIAKSDEFKNYNLEILDLVEEKKHVLGERVSAVLSQNLAFGTNESVYDYFNDVDLKFGTVSSSEGEKELTHASYGVLIKDKDANVRKEAFNKMHKAYANFNYTLGELYLNDVKESCFFNNIHKYKSMLEACCKGDKTSPKVFYTLINVVNKNLDKFYRFQKIKKEYLSLKEYYSYDNYLDVGKVDKNFSYEESVQIVLNALSVLGEDYSNVLKEAFENNWLDVYEKEAKTSGGFCLTVYGNKPYVLLNHNNTYNAVSTIAHEMGHAMHGYYSIKNQPIFKSNASIFICEVASIVNEILLVYYMINNSKNKQEKLYYVHQLLSSFYSTIFRQTMFSEFEDFVYKAVENKQTIMVENLNEKYEALQKLYFGQDVKTTEFAKFEWSRIPHFYRPYYVYKYATGFISACIIARKIMSNNKNYLNKYIEFLSKGSSVYPIDLLKTVDVDITSEETLKEAFKLYEELLEEFEKLAKEK